MEKNPFIIYAFIDSQNLNLAVEEIGWTLDFRRFRIYLKERYGVSKAYLFIGYVPENKKLYRNLRDYEYQVIFKPTLKNKKGVIKGNCDAELVLHCMIEYSHFDKAVIVSGDGDFHCLVEYLQRQGKLFKIGIPNKQKYSALFRKFANHFFFVSDLRHLLEYKKERHSSRDSPLT